MHRLSLHIGTHKTGTTSVQRFLAANRELLREQHLVYAATDVGGYFPAQYAHHSIAHAIANGREAGSRTPEDARAYFDAVRSGLADEDHVVISAEPLYRHVLAGTPGNSRDQLPYIRAVRDAIGDFDVTVFVMLRRQDLFIESLYSEQVMVRPYVDDIDQFIADRASQTDYEQRLAQWAEVFGEDRIRVEVYEPATLKQPLEREFLEWIGGEWDERLQLGARRNVTVPRELVEYKRALNSGLNQSESPVVRRWMEMLTRRHPGAFSGLGKYYLTTDARVRLLRSVEAGNRRVAERYFGREQLFTDMTLPEHPEPQALAPERFEEITRVLVGKLAADAAARVR